VLLAVAGAAAGMITSYPAGAERAAAEVDVTFDYQGDVERAEVAAAQLSKATSKQERDRANAEIDAAMSNIEAVAPLSVKVRDDNGKGDKVEVTTRAMRFQRVRGGRGRSFALDGTPSAGGCVGVTVTYRKYERWTTTYKFNLSKSWCFNNSNGDIAYINTNSWFSSVAQPWSGTAYAINNAWVSPRSHSSFAQGEAKWCLLTYGCVQYDYPYVEIVAYADGTWTSRAGR
jgi:hypothetical protein